MPTLKAKIGGAWVPIAGPGSGADEVFVGASDPGAAYELWYDTSDPGASVALPPNVAWGIVGQVNNGNQVSCPINTVTYLTTAIPLTLRSDRKYRFSWTFRAVGRQDGADTPANQNIVLYDNVTTLQAWLDSWHQFRGQWSTFTGFIIKDGDGVARQFRIGIGQAGSQPGVALYVFPTWFTIEDVGPAVRTML